jgi:transcriptional regulator with XRE-family HTH domain
MSGAKLSARGARAMLRAFGAEVRRRRLEQGLSLEAFGARADLTANFIGMIETGRKEASLSTVLKLACGLGCKPGELFDTETLSAAARTAGGLFDAIKTPAERKAVLKLLRALERLYSKPSRRSPRRAAK